jgi:hypothetical protein
MLSEERSDESKDPYCGRISLVAGHPDPQTAAFVE